MAPGQACPAPAASACKQLKVSPDQLRKSSDNKPNSTHSGEWRKGVGAAPGGWTLGYDILEFYKNFNSTVAAKPPVLKSRTRIAERKLETLAADAGPIVREPV